MRVASLPWYDLREVREATDALWTGVASRLRRAGLDRVPASLDRTMAYEETWRHPDFLFGQACGYDALLSCPEQLQVVATPCYSAPGCRGHSYASYIVVKEDSPARHLRDLRGARCVINTATSHSGMNALRSMVATLAPDGSFFASVARSGGHETSMAMIEAGEADVAAIDCVTHALIARHRPVELAGTRILCSTASAPAPPYVTSRSLLPSELGLLRAALTDAWRDPSLEPARRALFLSGLELVPLERYQPIAHHEQAALGLGYHELPGAWS